MNQAIKALDTAILARISEGVLNFADLFVGDVATLARAASGQRGGGTGIAFQVVDRRIDALLRVGAITTRGRGWAVAVAHEPEEQLVEETA